jgi:hypothetical protein
MKSIVSKALLSVFLIASAADATEVKSYANPTYGLSIDYPADFIPLEGKLTGGRRVEAFVDKNDPDTSLSIVVTPIPADFSRLTSFGGRDSLRQYVLPAGEGVTTSIVNENVKGEMYTLEYIINLPDAPTRHVQSIFALRPQESIIAVNIQTKEESYPTMKEKLQVILPSFKYLEYGSAE